MALAPGDRVGPYQVIAALGAGGMGEVYRAHDGRLGRDVAIKILTASVAADAARRARFEKEARVVAALNHPGIVGIYDLGSHEGLFYLVTELVEGETLRAALAAGPVPPRKAVEWGMRIADALVAAHAAAIVHRDLKPENIMITRDGRPKILDFGLARNAAAPTSESAETLTAFKTDSGVVLGTAGYMSPEQVRAQSADHRSDLFSLGLILHEMLSGQRAFERDSAVETMAAIARDDAPDLPEAVPAALRQIVRHCMEKEPGRRFQSAHDLAFALRNLALSPSSASVTSAAPPPALAAGLAAGATMRRYWWPAAAAVFAALTGLFGAALWRQKPLPDISAYTFTPLATDRGVEMHAAWSYDGKRVAYVRQQRRSQLWVRSLDSHTALQLTPVEFGALYDLNWTPDGAWIYFCADGPPAAETEGPPPINVWRMSLAGGPPERILPGVNARAITVSPDGNALVIDARGDGLVISSPIGSPVKRYEPQPQSAGPGPGGSPGPGGGGPGQGPGSNRLRFSPDGKSILFRSGRPGGARTAWLLPYPPGSGSMRVALADPGPGSFAWFPDGKYLLHSMPGTKPYAVALGSDQTIPVLATARPVAQAVVSPDGKRIIYTHLTAQGGDLWQIPVNGAAPRPMIATASSERAAVWSPVAHEFAYITDVSGASEIWWRDNDGRSRPVVTRADLDGANIINNIVSISPEGQRIAFVAASAGQAGTVWIAPLSGGPPVRWNRPGESFAVVAWHPSGDSVFVGGVQPKVAFLQLPVSGIGAAVELPSPGPVHLPAVSPGGVFVLSRSARNMVVIRLGAGEFTRLDPDLIAAGWGRDDNSLYVVRRQGATQEFGVLAWRSGAFHRISSLDSDLEFSSTLSVSPDGNLAVATHMDSEGDLWMLEGFVLPRPFWQRLLR